MKKYYKKILLILCIGLFLVLLRFFGIYKYINFQTLKENRAFLQTYVNDHYWFSVLIYISLYILVIAASIPIGSALTLISGFLFGVFWGVIYTNIGATIGAACTFLIVRYLARDLFERKFHNKLAKFNENIKTYGANYLLLARFIVVIPFVLVNIFAALTRIPLSTFIWTTSIGIIPGSVVYAYAGREIININSIKDIFSLKILMVFLVLILLGLLSIFAKKYQKIINKILKR